MSTAPVSVATACDSPPKVQSKRRLSRSWVQAAFTLGDQMVVSLVSAITTVIVGRACSKEELGVFSFGTTMLWRAMGIPTSLVWSPYAARVVHMGPAAIKRYAGSSAMLAILVGVLQAVVLTLAFVVTQLLGLVWEIPAWIPMLMLTLAPLLLAATIREHARRTSIADFRGHELLAVDVPIGLVQLGALLALWHYELLNFATALLTMAAASGLTAIWYVVEWPRLAVHWKLVKLHLKSNLRFGSWLLAVSVAILLCDLILRAMLAQYHGIREVGTFASAYLIVSLINPLFVAATTFSRSLAARVFAEQGRAGLVKFAWRGTAAAMVIALAATAAITLVGEQLVVLLFESEFASRYVIGAVTLGYCLQGVLIPIEAAQMALEQGRALFAVSILKMAVVLLPGIPLVWWQGAAGIGWTIAVQSVVALIVTWVLFTTVSRE
ncbi:lipopolysaccharide biosynthesis protein [Aeoliella sp. SH292]|uniref:lipopolysaccharide biosynthesis protein n=1 Tax=Aeoliella sp. SH292 TaxID=3454464 RepID=UPI003F9A3527